ncbi:hypothetical protein LLG10_06945 [bacterium]|nr:hypothetical protein [bacterium]
MIINNNIIGIVIIMTVQVFLSIFFPITLPFQLLVSTFLLLIFLLFLKNPIKKLWEEVKNRNYISVILIIEGTLFISIFIWAFFAIDAERYLFMPNSTGFFSLIVLLTSMLLISYNLIEKPLFISNRDKVPYRNCEIFFSILFFSIGLIGIIIQSKGQKNSYYYLIKLLTYTSCILVTVLPRYQLFRFLEEKKGNP